MIYALSLYFVVCHRPVGRCSNLTLEINRTGSLPPLPPACGGPQPTRVGVSGSLALSAAVLLAEMFLVRHCFVRESVGLSGLSVGNVSSIDMLSVQTGRVFSVLL